MPRKKNLFELSLVGVKTDPISILYHKLGDFSVIFSIRNAVPQFSGDKDKYRQFHKTFSDIVKILGEGYTIQKQDIFCHKNYKPEEEKDYLGQKFEQHFEGRTYNDIQSYLIITKNVTRVKFFQFDQKEFDAFIKKTGKVQAFLDEQNYRPRLLNEEEIDFLIKRYLAQNFSDDYFSVRNFKVEEDKISFSSETLKVISLVDVDEINFPTTIRPYSITTKGKQFPADIMSFLHGTPHCRNIIYNQVIRIPDQRRELANLEVKRRRHSSMPDPANAVCVEDIDNVLRLIQRTNDFLVYCHFDILLFGSDFDVTSAQNYIESNLARIGIIPSDNAYNQKELFECSFPGHTNGLKKYDLFLTTAMPALCLLYKESPAISENGTFKIKLTDRQGIPINIDTSDQPMENGRITNRNKFVLGPSGSGKSFFMNTFTQQSHIQETDVVIVDTGHSYSGLCQYVGGRYITYSETEPITMNPFFISHEEYNEEKRDFLKSLIALLWKGADGMISPVEDSALSDLVSKYYEAYFVEEKPFKANFNSFYNFAVERLKEIREKEKININVESFAYVLKKFYKGGQYDKILNKESDTSLFEESFIVFEIDNIKDNKVLFPITTLIIMDVFLQKMRIKKGRKALIIEEAWKAIASPMMASYIQYVYKTVRKWRGEAILVTQELEDIIGNEIIQNSVINNSDTIILLDQSKFKQNYTEISNILSLNETEQNKIFTINQLDNKVGRSRFMEVYINRGGIGEVFGIEEPIEAYLIFTTERKEKDAVNIYVRQFENYRAGIDAFVKDFEASGLTLGAFCESINKRGEIQLKKIS